MSRTNNLKIYVMAELKKSCDNVCYKIATDTTPYPYIVYDLNYIKDENRYNYQLEVNIWDENISTKAIEQVADDIEVAMDYVYSVDANQALATYINTRNNVVDPDKSLQRIRLLIDINYYGN